jgi:hypothetical protein
VRVWNAACSRRTASSHVCEPTHFRASGYWSVAIATSTLVGMGEHVGQQNIGRRRISRKCPGNQTAEAIGRRLLDVIVYGKSCRIGDKVILDDLAETSEVGDWKMPDFKMACTYAASQGWLVIEGGTLILTTAGSAAA